MENMNNEVMETKEEATFEVIDNCEVRNTEEPVYYPDTTSVDDSHGPNKLLVAAGIGACLFIAKKAKDKIKPKIQARKEKKEREEKERILAVLKETGLVQEPAAVKAEETVAAEAPTETEVWAPETYKFEEKTEG